MADGLNPGGTMSSPKAKKICAYCNVRVGNTTDEVIPRCFFPGPLPPTIVQVPACQPCNGDEKSKDDDYLRDMMLVDIENEGHPVTQGLLKERLIRSIGRNRSHLIRDGRKTKRRMPVHSSGGIYLGEANGFILDQTKTDRLFGRITRGMYFRLTNETRLPNDSTFEVAKVPFDGKQKAIDILTKFGPKPVYRIDETFECMYAIAKEEPSLSMWLYRFINVFVFVTTNGDKFGPKTPLPKTMTSFLS